MLEFEKKILLSKEEYQKLINEFSKNGKTIVQKNHYYDTRDYKLNKNGITCRIREKDNKFKATIKTHLPDKSIEESKQAFSEKDGSLFYKFDAFYQGVLTTYRTILFVSDEYEIVIDKNEYLGTVDYELEAEYFNANEVVIKPPLMLIANVLNCDTEKFSLRGNFSKSKSTRFFERKKLLHNSISDSIPEKLEEVLKFRSSSDIDIDNHNTNRYSIVFNENDGSKTSYFFSVPIYNINTKKFVDNTFIDIKDGFIAAGSNSLITISNNVCLENEKGKCEILLNKSITKLSEHALKVGKDQIGLTTNGIVYKADLSDKTKIALKLNLSKPFLTVRSNNQGITLLEDKFLPFLSVSCIGISDKNGKIIAPIKIDYQKLTDNLFTVIISSNNDCGQYMLFEINLYEKKLMQDTTVESAAPQKNNVYGGTAFIGHSLNYGEQWLYSKVDLSAIGEVVNKRINKAILHFPKLSENAAPLSALSVLSRFCSFGSNWENKTAASNFIGYPVDNGEYLDINITDILKMYTALFSDGIILRPKNSNDDYTVISTGDNCWKPQIIEINYE